MARYSDEAQKSTGMRWLGRSLDGFSYKEVLGCLDKCSATAELEFPSIRRICPPQRIAPTTSACTGTGRSDSRIQNNPLRYFPTRQDSQSWNDIYANLRDAVPPHHPGLVRPAELPEGFQVGRLDITRLSDRRS